MCGILGLLLADPDTVAAPEIAESLGLLQHRGQDACGIVTCGRRGRFYQCKSNGMVRDVLDERAVSSLLGGMGIGHVRYPTAGSSAHAEAQPFYVNSPYGITFAHNGNLTNTDHLRYYLDHYAHRHINTDSDSELMLNMLADNLQKTGKFRIDEDDVFRAITELMKQCNGAYAVVAMIAGFGLIAFRDPNGIRPVGYAKRATTVPIPNGSPHDYIIASESACADSSFTDWTDVQPGEAVIITREGLSTRQCVPVRNFAPDIFEHIYFARPDSVLDGISVYRSRMAMGDAIAVEAKKQLEAHNLVADVVIPVPDTSRVAALQCAQHLGLPYREGFVKNRYIGRTFIMPGQQARRKNVRRKLNAMALEFQNKNVLIVDDSVVRGTTSREIVQMAREAGANKVFFASCAPPIRYPNVYGIDMPSRKELVAYNRTEAEVCKHIDADLMIYQTLPDLVASCAQFNPAVQQFECSVFTGKYISGGVDEAYLANLEQLRADHIKAKKRSEVGVFVEQPTGCSGPMSGSEANIAVGLSDARAPLGKTPNGSSDQLLGLSNSFHDGFGSSSEDLARPPRDAATTPKPGL